MYAKQIANRQRSAAICLVDTDGERLQSNSEAATLNNRIFFFWSERQGMNARLNTQTHTKKVTMTLIRCVIWRRVYAVAALARAGGKRMRRARRATCNASGCN